MDYILVNILHIDLSICKDLFHLVNVLLDFSPLGGGALLFRGGHTDTMTKITDTMPNIINTMTKITDPMTKITDTMTKITDTMTKITDTMTKCVFLLLLALYNFTFAQIS